MRHPALLVRQSKNKNRKSRMRCSTSCSFLSRQFVESVAQSVSSVLALVCLQLYVSFFLSVAAKILRKTSAWYASNFPFVYCFAISDGKSNTFFIYNKHFVSFFTQKRFCVYEWSLFFALFLENKCTRILLYTQLSYLDLQVKIS